MAIQVFEIPTQPGRPQSQTIELAGVSYSLWIYWDVPAALWVLDIADETGVAIVSGLPLVTGVDLLEQYAYLNIGGALVVQSDFDWRVPPTFDNLGTLGHLYFIPTLPPPLSGITIPAAPQSRVFAGVGDAVGVGPPPPPGVTLPPPTRPPPPDGGVGPGGCNSIFIWRNTWVRDNIPGPPLSQARGSDSPVTSQLDRYGSYYTPNMPIIDISGNMVIAYTSTMFANDIDTFAGTVIVNRGTGFSGGVGVKWGPVLDGRYAIGYMKAGATGSTFFHWFGVFETQTTGAPILRGLVRTENLLGPPYSEMGPFSIANGQTLNDPIMFRSSWALGGNHMTLAFLPSINDIITGVYNAGYPHSGFSRYEVPNVFYQNIVSEALSNYLLPPGYPGNENHFGGWTLPSSGGGTNYYLYFNRRYTQDQAQTGTLPPPANVEVRDVIRVAQPLGSVIKINLGVISYAPLAALCAGGSHLPVTPNYTFDNANWTDVVTGAVVVPFTDEYHYMSTGVEGGKDHYQMQPALIAAPIPPSPAWTIIMAMPGIEDFRVYGAPSGGGGTGKEWSTIRLFHYDPSTEKFTQRFMFACVVFSMDNIPGGFFSDNHIIASLSGGNLYLNGFSIQSGDAYRTNFATVPV
jgi:hypothetical protein